MHFEISEKRTRIYVSLYDNAGLISNSFPRNSQQKRWKLSLSTTPLSFVAPSPGNQRVTDRRITRP